MCSPRPFHPFKADEMTELPGLSGVCAVCADGKRLLLPCPLGETLNPRFHKYAPRFFTGCSDHFTSEDERRFYTPRETRSDTKRRTWLLSRQPTPVILMASLLLCDRTDVLYSDVVGGTLDLSVIASGQGGEAGKVQRLGHHRGYNRVGCLKTVHLVGSFQDRDGGYLLIVIKHYLETWGYVFSSSGVQAGKLDTGWYQDRGQDHPMEVIRRISPSDPSN